LTHFGPGAIAILGDDCFAGLRAHKVEKIGAGYLVWAYPSVSEAGTPAALEAEATIMGHFGKEHFFDKNLANVDGLKTDEVTAARVERKIEQIHAARK